MLLQVELEASVAPAIDQPEPRRERRDDAFPIVGRPSVAEFVAHTGGGVLEARCRCRWRGGFAGGVAGVELGIGGVELGGVESHHQDAVAVLVHLVDVQRLDLGLSDLAIGAREARSHEREPSAAGREHAGLELRCGHLEEDPDELEHVLAIELELDHGAAIDAAEISAEGRGHGGPVARHPGGLDGTLCPGRGILEPDRERLAGERVEAGKRVALLADVVDVVPDHAAVAAELLEHQERALVRAAARAAGPEVRAAEQQDGRERARTSSSRTVMFSATASIER